ncbi:MAG: peptidoglycan D,D-transpeptidase FtsI family protein [Hyphomicrobiaceae bacterium]
MPERPSEMAARPRLALLALGLVVVLGAIAGQLTRLALIGRHDTRTAMAEPIARTFARPDIVDRHGRVLATDVAAPSLYADPALILDLDEMLEKLVQTLPELNESELRRSLGDRSRRFAWIQRGLTPIEAQRVHELGLPGLGFRREPKRVHPAGSLAGHIIGHVNIDNKGLDGVERYIDEQQGLDAVGGAVASRLQAVRLSIDLGVQHAVSDELQAAMERYRAKGAGAVVMDAETGEILTAVSLPGIDPARASEALDPARIDRLHGGVYELGSIFKALTIAMALEDGRANLDTMYDVTRPLEIGRHKITDLHPQRRPLSVRDVFLHSSNVGAGMLALEAGAEPQRAFLARLGLIDGMRTEVGPVTAPLKPQRWDRIETVTISYGHGLAVAPVQFVAAAATLVNGGFKVVPTFIKAKGETARAEAALRTRLLSAETSAALRQIMRLNVTAAHGTGRRAEVAGYRPGGKTGTAEMPGIGGYQTKAVIASFVAAMPMDAPRYVMLVSLFEPQGTPETRGQITAGVNAAPTTGRIIQRIGPILGLLPRRLDAVATPAFDDGGDAK